MYNFSENFAGCMPRRGLYVVRVCDAEREGSPLVARWIDPQAEKRVSCEREELCDQPEAGEIPLEFEPEILCGIESF